VYSAHRRLHTYASIDHVSLYNHNSKQTWVNLALHMHIMLATSNLLYVCMSLPNCNRLLV